MPPLGIGNPGQLCYALSFFQLLAATKLFQLQDTVELSSAQGTLFSLLECLIAYFQGKNVVNKSNRQRTQMTTLKSTLKKIVTKSWPDVDINEPQEIIEFLSRIHNKTWDESDKEKVDKFNLSVRAVLNHSRKCTICNKIETEKILESHLLLYIDFSNSTQNDNLSEFAKAGLDYYFNDDQKYFCSQCHLTQPHKVEKRISFSQYPSVIYIAAERQYYHENLAKFNDKKIWFPFRLHMAQYFDGGHQCYYDLVAVVVFDEDRVNEEHNLLDGHFYVLIRDKDEPGKWWKVDDAEVTPVQEAYSIPSDNSGRWHLLLYEWDSSNNTPDISVPQRFSCQEIKKRKVLDNTDNFTQGAAKSTILHDGLIKRDVLKVNETCTLCNQCISQASTCDTCHRLICDSISCSKGVQNNGKPVCSVCVDEIRKRKRAAEQKSNETNLVEEDGVKPFYKWLSNVKYIYYIHRCNTYSLCWDNLVNDKQLSCKFVEQRLLYPYTNFLLQVKEQNPIVDTNSYGLNKDIPRIRLHELMIEWIIKQASVMNDETLAQKNKWLYSHEWEFMRCTLKGNTLKLIDSEKEYVNDTYYFSLKRRVAPVKPKKVEKKPEKEDSTEIKVPEEIYMVPTEFIVRWAMNLSSEKGCVKEFDELKDLCKKKPGQWIRVNVGPKINRSNELGAPYCYPSSTEGYRCVFRSLINAFHYIGETKARDLLVNRFIYSFQQQDIYKYVKKLVNSEGGLTPVDIKRYPKEKQLVNGEGGRTPVLIKTLSIDRMKDNFFWKYRSDWPTLCLLVGYCGTVKNAVTIVGDYIFDSSLTYTLPNTIESLNTICSDEGKKESNFGHVELAIRFIHSHHLNLNILYRALHDVALVTDDRIMIGEICLLVKETPQFLSVSHIPRLLKDLIKKFNNKGEGKYSITSYTSTPLPDLTGESIKIWIKQTIIQAEFQFVVIHGNKFYDGVDVKGKETNADSFQSLQMHVFRADHSVHELVIAK